MGTINSNVNAFNKRLLKRIKKIEEKGKFIPRDLSLRMKLLAQFFAPKLTWELVNNITNFPIKNGYRVQSIATNKGFPYNKWVNASVGFETLTGRYAFIHPKSGNLVKGFGDRTYGKSPGNWTWRGRARYFELAKEDTREYAKDYISSQYANAIRLKT